jgi:hypothetical protein
LRVDDEPSELRALTRISFVGSPPPHEVRLVKEGNTPSAAGAKLASGRDRPIGCISLLSAVSSILLSWLLD